MSARVGRRSIAVIAAALSIAMSVTAEEVKFMQDLDLSLYGTEDQGNTSSPFARLQAPSAWTLTPALYGDYTLRFQTDSGVSGQLTASATDVPSSSFSAAIDQAWVKATFGEGWALDFGRRTLNEWKGDGYWHPSDLVNNYLSWNAIGQAAGNDSVELYGLVPFSEFNIDFNVATVFTDIVAYPSDLPLFVTAGSILYPFEIRAKAAFQSGRLPRIGASASYSLESGSIYADALWLQDNPITESFGFGTSEGSWFRYSGGFQWTFDITQSRAAQSLFLQLEYQRQDDGLDSAQFSDYFSTLQSMPLIDSHGQSAYANEAGLMSTRFFTLGQDYLFADATLGEIANAHISVSESCLLNIDDLSFALQSSLTWSPRNLFSVCLSAINVGNLAGPSYGGEALNLPISAQYQLALSRSF